MQHIVSAHLPPDLGEHLLELPPELDLVDLALQIGADIQVVDGNSLLEDAGVREVGQRLEQIGVDVGRKVAAPVPFLMLFQIGFLYTGLLSIVQQYAGDEVVAAGLQPRRQGS